MSNVQDVNRPSAKQPKLKNLSPKGSPTAKAKRLPTGGRDRFKKGR
jgi:hypothetical protein